MSAPDRKKSLATDAKGNLVQMFSPEKVAKALDVHRRTVLRWIQSGQIRTVYSLPGAGVLRIPKDELDRLLRERDIAVKP